jgi:hypothetical protein
VVIGEEKGLRALAPVREGGPVQHDFPTLLPCGPFRAVE